VSAAGQALSAGQVWAEGQALSAGQVSQEGEKESLQAVVWRGTARSRTDNQQTLPSHHLRKCNLCTLDCPSTGWSGVRPCQRRNPSRGSCMQSTPRLGWAMAGSEPAASEPAASEPAASELAASEPAEPELWEQLWELGLVRTSPHRSLRSYSRSRRTTLSSHNCPCSQRHSSTEPAPALGAREPALGDPVVWELVWELGLMSTIPHRSRRSYPRSRHTTPSLHNCPCSQRHSSTEAAPALESVLELGVVLESVEVLESVQPSSALELVHRAEP